MNFAVLGAGKIARKLSTAVNGLDGVCAYAVASRDLAKAQAFAQEWGYQKAYGSYEEMLSDPEVDLVYIATPHSHHREHAMLALTYGKAVLCEKAFTANAKQAEELIAYAEEHKILLTEAIWTRYMPSRKMIDDLLASGVIGEVMGVQANLGYELTGIPRMEKPELAGGALLDLGVYTLNFASMVLGDDIVSTVSGVVLRGEGVDCQNTEFLTYRSGATATLHATMMAETDRTGMIFGTRGYMEIQNINNPEEIWIFNAEHQLQERIAVPAQINGYEYEVLACKKALEEGRIECQEMPHAETLTIMRQMDALREAWGVKYPWD